MLETAVPSQVHIVHQRQKEGENGGEIKINDNDQYLFSIKAPSKLSVVVAFGPLSFGHCEECNPLRPRG